MKVWRNQIIDKHFWAFYYFCKRQGDRVWIEKHVDGTADLYLEEKK